jgi:hypothetical protein
MNKQFALWLKGNIICLSLFLCLILHAQEFQVKGRITDSATKKPVVAATIENSTKKRSTVTDQEGNFTISASRGNNITVMYGSQGKNITVDGDGFLGIEINTTENQSSDVDVTALDDAAYYAA